jgi:hypothetical protein
LTVRFLADEDLRAGIVQALRSREPAIDILDVKTAGFRGMKDPALLELAAQQGRNLMTHDRQTMTRYFRARLDAGLSTPELFVVSQKPSAIGEIVEWLSFCLDTSPVYGQHHGRKSGAIKLFTCRRADRQ